MIREVKFDSQDRRIKQLICLSYKPRIAVFTLLFHYTCNTCHRFIPCCKAVDVISDPFQRLRHLPF